MSVNEPGTTYAPPPPGSDEFSAPGPAFVVDPLGNYLVDTGADYENQNFIVDPSGNFLVDKLGNYLVDTGELVSGTPNNIVDTGTLFTPVGPTIYVENDAE